MIAYSYVNIRSEQKKKKLNRILSIDRFLDMLINKKMTFVNPDLWDDPFECFYFNQEIEDKDGNKINLSEFKDSLFGNCWSFNSDNDFSWRVYAPYKNGVQITTSIEKLYKHFEYLKTSKEVINSFQIGKIYYNKWEDIRSHYEKSNKFNPFLDIFSNYSLFLKRIEFSHEKEIRILIRYQNINGKILRLDFDPNELIDSVLLDPRMTEQEYELYKRIIIQQGFKGKIRKSELYSMPILKLKYDNVSK